MKKLAFIIFQVALCCSLTAATDLLKTSTLTASPSAKGLPISASRNGSGSYELRKGNSEGRLVFHTVKGLPEMRPGKTYRVTATVKPVSGNLEARLVLNTPGAPEVRTVSCSPYPVTAPGVLLIQDITARSGEKQLRVHLMLSGEGAIRVTELTFAEVPPEELRGGGNLLKTSILSASPSIKGLPISEIRREDGSFELRKGNSDGQLIFHTADRMPEMEPGKTYRVTVTVKPVSGEMEARLVLNTPGAPTLRSIGGRQGEVVAPELRLVQDITANPGEKQLRVHLMLSGEGSLRVTELTFEEVQPPKPVSQKSFRGAELRRTFDILQCRKELPSADCIDFIGENNGGIIVRNLRWNAQEIKAVEVGFASHGEIGFLELDFRCTDGEKTFQGLSRETIVPDGKIRRVLFDLSHEKSWVGTVRELRIYWYGEAGRRTFASVEALPEVNILPFADRIRPGKTVEVSDILPRGEYTLRWSGKNPGAEFRFFDRMLKEIGKVSVPADKPEFSFRVPEQTMTSDFTAGGTGGVPVLTLDKLPNLDPPTVFWRGEWIWSRSGFLDVHTNVWFEKRIVLDRVPDEAVFVGTGDDRLELFVNGKSAGGSDEWIKPARIDIRALLQQGENQIVARVYNSEAWGGLLGELYVRIGDNVRYFPTGKDWRCHIGGTTMPEKFERDSFVLGAPPIAPWSNRFNYPYAGPVGEIEVTATAPGQFTAKVLKAPAVNTDRMFFRLREGSEPGKRVLGQIAPATGTWRTGTEVTVRYTIPTQYGAVRKLYLDTEYLQVAENAPVGVISPSPIPDGSLSTARIVGTGTRPYVEVNGEKLPPFYNSIMIPFAHDPDKREYLLQAALRCGTPYLRTACDMDDFWLGENEFDFSGIDRLLDVMASRAPNLKLILNVKCRMPYWWCRANPDDVTRYDSGQPIHQYKDRQALASKKYLKDVAVGLRALIHHLKSSPHRGLIIGLAISEGWNSEWFWTFADGNGKFALSGHSPADFATFRSYLREKYQTDEKLAAAWAKPGLTFDTIFMPTPADWTRSSIGFLLDPARDMALMDWYEFRNRSISEAIITLCGVVKEESGGRWLAGAYYGYFVAFSDIFHRLQSVGHLDIDRVLASPNVDFVTAPSFYTWRYPGGGDGVMQAADEFSCHGKLVIVEQDLRTYSEKDRYARSARLSTPEQSVAAINRGYGMAIARGIGTHWYEMYETWFREPLIISAIAEGNSAYRALPPVRGLTPVEICLISDLRSAYHTKINTVDGLHRATVGAILRRFPEVGAPFRHLMLNDLLSTVKAPHKLYIVTNLLVLDPAQRAELMARFAREKATVIWLWGAGLYDGRSGPDQSKMEELLGLKFVMDRVMRRPKMRFDAKFGNREVMNLNTSAPWFYPVSGFDTVVAKGRDGRPMMVKWQKDGVTHYFSTVMNLPPEIIRTIAAEAGVFLYNAPGGDIIYAGNDVVFLHAKTEGKKQLLLPRGGRLRGILGPLTGVELKSGEFFNAKAGETYGFLAE